MIDLEQFPGRLGVIQRVLPPYRVQLFDMLNSACVGGLSVFAGTPAPHEALIHSDRLNAAQLAKARNRHILRNTLYLCWQSGLRDWLERWQPDAVIAEANPRYVSTRLAVRWMHKHGRPIFGWGLGVMSLNRGLEGWRIRGRAKFIRRFDGMFAYSSRAAAEYAALGVPQERIFVCKNAVTPRPTRPPPQRAPEIGERPIVLFVGKLTDAKRVDLLIHASAALASTIDPDLRIVGEGPALEPLKSLAQNAYPSAKFYGSMHGPPLDALFDEADLFVLPGLGGLAIQEAMSHGLPVIVAEGDGTQDDLVRPENGWNVRPGDLSSLVETMRAALSSPAKLRAMGKSSYRIVSEEINLEKMVETFVRGLNAMSGPLIRM